MFLIDGSTIAISAVDPTSEAAIAMSDALWTEIQVRYGFTAPNLFEPVWTLDKRGGFWVAFDRSVPVGSIALIPLAGNQAELDAVYVAPTYRRKGLAAALLKVLEAHARQTRTAELLLRVGEPQSEALAFYQANGFTETEPFGRWTTDPTAVCFKKWLT